MKLSQLIKETIVLNRKMRDLRRIDKACDKRLKLIAKYKANEAYIQFLLKEYKEKWYPEKVWKNERT